MDSITPGPSILLIVNLAALAYVLVHHPRTRAHRAAAVLALGVSIWCLGGVLSLLAEDERPWLRFATLGALFMPANFVFFAEALAGEHERRRSRFVLPLCYVAATVLYFRLDYTALLRGTLTPAWRLDGYRFIGPAPIFAGVYTCAAWSYALFRLFALLPLYPGRLERGPVRKAIIALLAPTILGAILIPALGSTPGASVPTISLVGVVISEALLLTSFQERLVPLDVAFLLRKAVLYVLSCVLVGAATIGAVVALQRFVRLESQRETAWACAGVGLGITLVFAALKDQLEELVERTFFWKTYHYERLIHEFRGELRSSRERLRRAERLAAVGELAAVVAHEIKNPLGPIRGYAELLAAEIPRNPALASNPLLTKGVAIIQEEVEKIDKRVRDLLEMGREELARVEPCNLGLILERALMLIQYEHRGLSGVTVSQEVAPELPPMEGNPDLLEQAFINVLQNAMEAMPKGGRLRVIARPGAPPPPAPDARIQVAISDSGVGIPRERLASLFDAFHTTKRKGHGLGLVIVKSIIEKHGGVITVESNPGHGTVFTFDLPLHRPAADAA